MFICFFAPLFFCLLVLILLFASLVLFVLRRSTAPLSSATFSASTGALLRLLDDRGVDGGAASGDEERSARRAALRETLRRDEQCIAGASCSSALASSDGAAARAAARFAERSSFPHLCFLSQLFVLLVLFSFSFPHRLLRLTLPPSLPPSLPRPTPNPLRTHVRAPPSTLAAVMGEVHALALRASQRGAASSGCVVALGANVVRFMLDEGNVRRAFFERAARTRDDDALRDVLAAARRCGEQARGLDEGNVRRAFFERGGDLEWSAAIEHVRWRLAGAADAIALDEDAGDLICAQLERSAAKAVLLARPAALAAALRDSDPAFATLVPGTAHALLRLLCEWRIECVGAAAAQRQRAAAGTRDGGGGGGHAADVDVDVDVDAMARCAHVLSELALLAPEVDYKRLMGEDLGFSFLDGAAEAHIGPLASEMLLEAMLLDRSQSEGAGGALTRDELARVARCAPVKHGASPSDVWFKYLRARIAAMAVAAARGGRWSGSGSGSESGATEEVESAMVALCAEALAEMTPRTAVRAALLIGMPQERPRRALLRLRRQVLADATKRLESGAAVGADEAEGGGVDPAARRALTHATSLACVVSQISAVGADGVLDADNLARWLDAVERTKGSFCSILYSLFCLYSLFFCLLIYSFVCSSILLRTKGDGSALSALAETMASEGVPRPVLLPILAAARSGGVGIPSEVLLPRRSEAQRDAVSPASPAQPASRRAAVATASDAPDATCDANDAGERSSSRRGNVLPVDEAALAGQGTAGKAEVEVGALASAVLSTADDDGAAPASHTHVRARLASSAESLYATAFERALGVVATSFAASASAPPDAASGAEVAADAAADAAMGGAGDATRTLFKLLVAERDTPAAPLLLRASRFCAAGTDERTLRDEAR